jgi:hypothetical protein
MCGIAIEIVDEGELVCISESVTLEPFRKAVERSRKHHGAISDLIFPARQAKSVHLDGAFRKTFLVSEIAVIGEIDVLEGADDEADVLGEDERFTGEAGGLARSVCRVYDLQCVSKQSAPQSRSLRRLSGHQSR